MMRTVDWSIRPIPNKTPSVAAEPLDSRDACCKERPMNVRHHVFRWALVGLWSALIGSTLLFASSLRAQGTPTLKIVAPSDSSTASGPVLVRIEHSGIRFDGVKLGADPEPGVGNWHVNIDGKYAGLSVSNVIEIPNDAFPIISAGKHTITADLHQNNHAPLAPPVSQSITVNFTQEVKLVTVMNGPPSLKLIDPKQDASISAPVVVRIEHS